MIRFHRIEKIYGRKIVTAEPMDERDFAFEKGQTWDESKPNRVGYKVIYSDDRYTSWSPKDVFERSYREVTLKEAEMVANGQYVMADTGGATITPS